MEEGSKGGARWRMHGRPSERYIPWSTTVTVTEQVLGFVTSVTTYPNCSPIYYISAREPTFTHPELLFAKILHSGDSLVRPLHQCLSFELRTLTWQWKWTSHDRSHEMIKGWVIGKRLPASCLSYNMYFVPFSIICQKSCCCDLVGPSLCWLSLSGRISWTEFNNQWINSPVYSWINDLGGDFFAAKGTVAKHEVYQQELYLVPGGNQMTLSALFPAGESFLSGLIYRLVEKRGKGIIDNTFDMDGAPFANESHERFEIFL